MIRMLMLGVSIILACAVGTTAHGDDDFYLQKIYENGEVIGCKDEASFDRLLSRELIENIAQDCKPELVSGKLIFTGWTMFGQTFDGVVARKYVMETPEGTIRFAWPYPLEMSQYNVFSGPYEEEATEPLMFTVPIPNVTLDSPEIVYAAAQ